MSVESVAKYLDKFGYKDRIKIFEKSSATVELAALAVGCEPGQIAKTLTFLVSEKPVMIVCAGDVKIDNPKFKAQFKEKAKMIPAPAVFDYVGHEIGGVCPFDVKPGVTIYLDISLKENNIVYPAAGSDHSAVKFSLEELEKVTNNPLWIDVCKKIES